MTEKSSYWTTLIKKNAQALDPMERLSEVIFGLIMVLTFTCSISAATSGKEEIRTMLWAALGCNTAWGIVDSFMILMATLFTRGEGIKVLLSIRRASNKDEANNIIRENLPPVVETVLNTKQVDVIRDELMKLPQPPEKAIFTIQDFKNAIVVFFLVFISTFPVAIPFFIITEPLFALRVSNSIALVLLFMAGIFLGKKTGYSPLGMGLIFSVTGAALVSLTMALGG